MNTPAQRIVLAGGSGFLGAILASYFSRQSFEIVVLGRSPTSPPSGATHVSWDGKSLGPWAKMVDGAWAVINLAGRTVDCRYNRKNRQLILASRIESTRILGEAIAACANPPKVWLNSSTATIYKHSYDRAMDEETGVIGSTPEARDEFSVQVAQAWEEAVLKADTPATRKVALRTAMVMGVGRNSAFPALSRLARFGLGGPMAGGQQYISWIHEQDFCQALQWILEHPELKSPVNVVSPNPLPNREAMQILREACGARFGLPATKWMLELGAFVLRTETELIIKSRRVVPSRLLASGFQFEFPSFREAVLDLLRGNS